MQLLARKINLGNELQEKKNCETSVKPSWGRKRSYREATAAQETYQFQAEP